ARSARSEVDRRLNGKLVRLTASHATALTIARSRGGKSGLATPARLIGQGEVATSPAVPPQAHRVRMQLDRCSGRRARYRWRFVKQEDQPSPLMLAVRRSSPTDDASTMIKEIGRKRGLV